MRILILTPTALPTISGNAVTAERWRRGLLDRGCGVRVLVGQGLAPETLAEEVRRFKPDVLHAHHAFRSGSVAAAAPTGPALVVSPAGTDVYVDLVDPERGPVVREVLARARAVVCQGSETARHVETEIPELEGRVHRVPKAFAWLGDEPFDLRAAARCGRDDVLFLLPAGVRPVKGNLECLRALEILWRLRPSVRAVFAGPPLDTAYAARFGREVAEHSAFATWLPAIPPTAMRAAYRGADVVLNASRAEGLANALLEAAAAGRPVLASDVPGNRRPVLGEDGSHSAGLLYRADQPDDFVDQALRLVDDPSLRDRLGRAGSARAAALPTPEEEAEALAAAYAKAIEVEAQSR